MSNVENLRQEWIDKDEQSLTGYGNKLGIKLSNDSNIERTSNGIRLKDTIEGTKTFTGNINIEGIVGLSNPLSGPVDGGEF